MGQARPVKPDRHDVGQSNQYQELTAQAVDWSNKQAVLISGCPLQAVHGGTAVITALVLLVRWQNT